jgi:endo-alpha-1,4-polygalactosaminidase (GH114 family)
MYHIKTFFITLSLFFATISTYANSVTLHIGWNQISPMSELTILEIKSQLDSNLEEIRGDEKVYKKRNPSFLNSFEKFIKTEKYWIKVKSEGVLNFKSNSWYKPDVDTSWQIQLKGEINSYYDAIVYDIDLFDTSTSKIQSLKNSGKKVICYFSAGSLESWREDASSFPSSILGNSMKNWENEKWLDIRDAKLKPIMIARLDLAKQKGCDGVEIDNVNGYTNPTGFDLTYSDQLIYNKFLATTAHQRGLSIGLKNDLEQIEELEPFFDFLVNEECFEYMECDKLQPFINAGKPVFNIEYDLNLGKDNICQSAKQRGFQTLILPMELDDSFRIVCD